MSLRDYARKRRFADTPEPAEDAPATRGRRPIFVVQLHNARARHYDFRLEADGALKSWAVPKGPSLRAGEKRLAVQVEDHPISYAGFQGEIPEGNYGAGHVLVFDHGVWACEGEPLEGIAAGKLDFTLHGGKLRGGWKLVRTGMQGGRGGGKPQWLLIKRNDRFAQDVEANDLVEVEPGPESSATAGRLKISGAARIPAKPTASRKPSTSIVSKRAPVAAAAAQKRMSAKNKTSPSRRRRNDAGWAKRALALEGARAKPFAIDFKPELATLRETPPAGDDWLHEVKLDGYRMLADVVDGVVKLRSRNGLDWTPDFPEIIEAINALPVGDLRLDGELVALDATGHSDFATLQRTLQGTSNAALRYIVFDMPGIAGVDISSTGLVERKALLLELFDGAAPELVFSTHVIGHGNEVFEATGKQGLEGIISKRVDAQYTSSRSAQWIKVKHAQSDEFVVVGYTSPKGARTGFGALLMAAVDAGALRYAGRVGTGYGDKTLREVFKQLQPLRRTTATLALPDHLPHDKRDNGTVHWVEPQLVAEVAYRGWGKEGLLRQASFQRLRIDKTVEDLGMVGTTVRKKTATKKAARPAGAVGPKGAKTPSSAVLVMKKGATPSNAASDVRISSPDRVVFAEAGFTKGQVAEYYRAVADWILPELANRPLSLVR
nr:non-homologous end-joining DNA ligase [Pseudomonadota bacterium]